MTPPHDYTLEELAEDVRNMIAFLRENGVLGLQEGIDFHAITVLTENGEVDIDLDDGIEIEVPPSILQKIRATSLQGPLS